MIALSRVRSNAELNLLHKTEEHANNECEHHIAEYREYTNQQWLCPASARIRPPELIFDVPGLVSAGREIPSEQVRKSDTLGGTLGEHEAEHEVGAEHDEARYEPAFRQCGLSGFAKGLPVEHVKKRTERRGEQQAPVCCGVWVPNRRRLFQLLAVGNPCCRWAIWISRHISIQNRHNDSALPWGARGVAAREM